MKTLEMEMSNQPQMQQCVMDSRHAVAFIYYCHDYMFFFFIILINSLPEFVLVLFQSAGQGVVS